MLTVERIKEMFDLQEQLETYISGENWREQNHDYALCVHMECAEIIDCIGWKHWKDIGKPPNMNKIAGELVDVWHFCMAYVLQQTGENGVNYQFVYDQIIEALEDYDESYRERFIEAAIGMSFSMYGNKIVPFGNFVVMMSVCGMSWDDMYKLYIAKNVLNRFRQDNGYKDGTYQKYWGGKEDNEHVMELCQLLDTNDNLSSVELYGMLSERYPVTL